MGQWSSDTCPRWKVIVFHKGERVEKLFHNPKKGQSLVAQLSERGVKAHVVCRRYPHFPPKGEAPEPGMLWCPYCRRWRWFKVPKKRPPFSTLEIKCCAWCWISEDDAFVKNYNGTWTGVVRKKRRNRDARKKRRTRR